MEPRHNIQVVYEYVESKKSFMYLYRDLGHYNKYQYITKVYVKPTKKQHKALVRQCLLVCKSWYEWDNL